jgi:hydrogenase maturation protease
VDDRPPLVIGYGNTLRGDDGVGRVVARQIKAEIGAAAVEVIEAYGLTPDVSARVSRASRVVFIDARRGLEAADIKVEELTPEDSASANWTMGHFLAPSQVLAMAGALYGHCPPASLVMIGGQCWEENDRLSAAVQRAVPKAVRAVIRQLNSRRVESSAH